MEVEVADLRILTYPDPILREVAVSIESIDETVAAVAARMIELMHEGDGAGLAAPQVGISWRMFVTRANDDHPDRVYVNPKVAILEADQTARPEGCLSLPGITIDLNRPESASVTALDLEGREFTLLDRDLLARIWQHEADHLDGVLIIDKMSPMDRLATRKVLKELEAASL